MHHHYVLLVITHNTSFLLFLLSPTEARQTLSPHRQMLSVVPSGAIHRWHRTFCMPTEATTWWLVWHDVRSIHEVYIRCMSRCGRIVLSFQSKADEFVPPTIRNQPWATGMHFLFPCHRQGTSYYPLFRVQTEPLPYIPHSADSQSDNSKNHHTPVHHQLS